VPDIQASEVTRMIATESADFINKSTSSFRDQSVICRLRLIIINIFLNYSQIIELSITIGDIFCGSKGFQTWPLKL